MSPILFVSDVHLHPGNGQILNAFVRFLRNAAQECQRLYILGDLFDFWLGDDDVHNPWLNDLIGALRALNAGGVEAFFMQGNRDFLLGRDFCRHTGLTLLPDPSIVKVFDKRVLISHGDLFCSLDRYYLLWRALVHRPTVQWAYTSLPLRWRRQIANRVASGLKRHRPPIDSAYLKRTDVVPDSIEEYLKHHPADLMIHGHTHRPAIHQQKGADGFIERIVIGDWGNKNTVVALEADGCRRYTFAPELSAS